MTAYALAALYLTVACIVVWMHDGALVNANRRNLRQSITVGLLWPVWSTIYVLSELEERLR